MLGLSNFCDGKSEIILLFGIVHVGKRSSSFQKLGFLTDPDQSVVKIQNFQISDDNLVHLGLTEAMNLNLDKIYVGSFGI